MSAHQWKLVVEVVAILWLIVLNLRGVKESLQVLLPIFLLFLVTHLILIVGAIVLNLNVAADVVHRVVRDEQTGS